MINVPLRLIVNRRIFLTSTLSDPEKIKPHLQGGLWIYAGKDLNRFHAFKKCLGKKIIQASPAQFREFTISNRHAFVQWTEGVHTRYGHDLTHWLSDTFSSNPYMSNLFLYCMNVSWFRTLLKEYPERDIVFVAESRALLLIADVIASEDNNNRIYKYGFNKEIIRFFYRLGRSTLGGYVRLLLFFIRYICAYRIHRDNNKLKGISVIIDTYIFENSFDKTGKFINKYFSELYGFLSEKDISVGLFPTFYYIPLKKLKYIFKSICQCNTKFVLLENILKPIDYLSVLLYPIKRLKHFERVQSFLGINVQPLVNENNWIRINSSGFILSLLINKLTKRLREKGIRPTAYINWSENQTPHKAIILGFHRNFPEVEVIGGKPFIPPLNNINLFSTNTERTFGVAPDRIITCGRRLKNIFSVYDKEGRYDVGPSFRYGYLRDAVDGNHIYSGDINKCKTILILLPYSESISRYILTSSARAIRNAMDNGWNIKIKVHPTLTKSDRAELLKEYDVHNECVEVVDEEMVSLLPKAYAVVSSASSVVLESICLGIPVISIGMPIGLDFNMLDYLPSSMWRLVFTDDEIDKGLNEWALQHPLSYDERKKIGLEILSGFFEENTNDSMRVYMESLKDV